MNASNLTASPTRSNVDTGITVNPRHAKITTCLTSKKEREKKIIVHIPVLQRLSNKIFFETEIFKLQQFTRSLNNLYNYCRFATCEKDFQRDFFLFK